MVTHYVACDRAGFAGAVRYCTAFCRAIRAPTGTAGPEAQAGTGG